MKTQEKSVIDVRQRMMAKHEFGVELSKDCTEKDAVRILKRAGKYSKNPKTAWSNKVSH